MYAQNKLNEMFVKQYELQERLKNDIHRKEYQRLMVYCNIYIVMCIS